MYFMKTTIDIPNDIYRRVKAKTAMQSRTIREITVSLYLGWITSQEAVVETSSPDVTATPNWFASAKSYAKKVSSHDMDSIRTSIAAGRKNKG